MTVTEFIEKLKSMPPDANVVLYDSTRVAYEASGEPSGEGLYYDFDFYFDKEIFFNSEDEEQENPIPTLVISFESDYEEKAKELAELEEELKSYELKNKIDE